MNRHLLFSLLFSAALLTDCSTRCLHTTNGDSKKKVNQPIEHGWIMEQAAQYWLASVLTDEHSATINYKKPWLRAEELATLTEGHVRVSVPVQQGNPMPRFGVVYRQPQTGGTICFTDSACKLPTVTGDTLSAIGTVCYNLCDPLYQPSSNQSSEPGKPANPTLYVQHRGHGLFTVFEMNRVRKYDDDGNWQWNPLRQPSWWPVVISVSDKGDSLFISRGRQPVETFYVEHL